MAKASCSPNVGTLTTFAVTLYRSQRIPEQVEGYRAESFGLGGFRDRSLFFFSFFFFLSFDRFVRKVFTEFLLFTTAYRNPRAADSGKLCSAIISKHIHFCLYLHFFQRGATGINTVVKVVVEFPITKYFYLESRSVKFLSKIFPRI